MPPSSTRQLDEICRLYFNNLNQVIGKETISIHVDQHKVSQTNYRLNIDSVKSHLYPIHNSNIYVREISRVLQVGNYNNVETNNGNYNVLTYTAPTPNINDVKISLSIYAKQIGDTI